MKLTKINDEWVAAGNDPFPPDSDRPRTDPTPQDRKINPHPRVERISQGKFYVRGLVIHPSGSFSSYTFSAECSHCHQAIEVQLDAPVKAPKYVKDEACRIAIVEHLRTEHPRPKKKVA
jgi:hypothetical protein